MNPVRTRRARYGWAIAAVLLSAGAHASTDTAPLDPELLLAPAASPVTAQLRDAPQVDKAQSFNAFIRGDAPPARVAGTTRGPANPPPSPSLLWVLGAGIIGLATIARRRSH